MSTEVCQQMSGHACPGDVSQFELLWRIKLVGVLYHPHNKALIPKTTFLYDHDYIIRILYKNCH